MAVIMVTTLIMVIFVIAVFVGSSLLLHIVSIDIALHRTTAADDLIISSAVVKEVNPED